MNYNKLQEEIRSLTCDFVKDWQNCPTKWLQEIDVQCELSQRINALLKSQKLDVIRARHSHYQGEHDFSRLTCEPYVLGDKTKPLHPDIVVWDNPVSETQEINSGKWPMIWACEINYTTGEPDTNDLCRLQDMIRGNILRVGCWLNLIIHSTFDKPEDDIADPNLWIIEGRVSIN